MNGGVVVDSSAVGPMVLFDEADDLLQGLPEAFIAGIVAVPMHWHLEIASMMQNALRRKRLDHAAGRVAFETLDSFSVEVDTETGVHAWEETTRLAQLHGLTVYDAAYLELARRKRLALATSDIDLRDAAAAENVVLFGQ